MYTAIIFTLKMIILSCELNSFCNFTYSFNGGGVMMEFEIENNLIVIERTLKRGKTVSQDYCAITIDGQKR